MLPIPSLLHHKTKLRVVHITITLFIGIVLNRCVHFGFHKTQIMIDHPFRQAKMISQVAGVSRYLPFDHFIDPYDYPNVHNLLL